MTNLNIEWAEILKESRLRKHITQEDVAGMLGIKRQLISALETGKTRPSPEMIALLSNIYGVDLYRFVMLSLPADYVAEQHEYRAILESPMKNQDEEFGAKAIVREQIMKNDIKKLKSKAKRAKKKKVTYKKNED